MSGEKNLSNFTKKISFFDRGAKVIIKQIERNRQDKLFKDEIREQENAAMLKYLDELQKQDWEEVKKRKDLQKKLAVIIIDENNFLKIIILNFKKITG